MRQLILRGRWAAAATIVLIGSTLGVVAAQQDKTANGFRISPVRSEVTIEKGKNQNLTVTVENPSDAPTTARAVVNDFIASDQENGEPRLILDDKAPLPKNDFKKLVGTIPDVNLEPKEHKDVTVTLTVPADANSGGYYGAIRFAPVVNGQQSTVGLTASVGTLVLVTVPGNLTEKLDLVQLSAAQNGKATSFLTSGSVSVLTRLKNDGDIHLQPFGKVAVKDTFGKTIIQYEFNSTEPRANILPGSIRRFEDQLNKKNWFGRYTIESNLGYSQGSGSLITAKSTFWYIPGWALAVLALLIVAIAALIYWLLKRRDTRLHHKTKGDQ